jgi:ABC-type multidrug transport system fused ATPase/permease subunit
VNSILLFYQKLAGERIKVAVSKSMSNFAVNKLIYYEYQFFSAQENSSGNLAMRIDKGVEGISKTIKNIFVDILPLLTTALFAIIVMFHANALIGLISIIIIPIYAYLSIKQATLQGGVRLKIQENKEQRNNRVVRIFSSIPIIKSFVAERFEIDKHTQSNDALSTIELEHHRTNFKFDGVKNFSEQLGLVGVLVATLYLVSSGNANIGAITLHILLFSNIAAPIKHIHKIYDEYQEAITYATSFFKNLEASEFFPNDGNIVIPSIVGNIVVDNLSFAYMKEGKNVLNHVSMKIEAGKTTAIVGLSGAGKTTLINLLLKFYRPTSGSIQIDGVAIEQLKTANYREHIGVVLQNNHIFPGSIRENISYGLASVSNEQILEATKKAYVFDVIENLPDGLDSDAASLSGGQKQRLAIARVFLKDPKILFLDEPTASLDAIAAEQIKDSLEAIKKNRTVIVISHDVSQFIDADTIYVLENGVIKQNGTHEELKQVSGLYQDIVSASQRSLKMDQW